MNHTTVPKAHDMAEDGLNSSSSTDVDMLPFVLGGRSFLIDTGGVAGVNKFRPYMPVPLSPQHVLGLVYMNGTSFTLIDVYQLLFGIKTRSEYRRQILLRHRTKRVAIAAEAVSSVMRVSGKVLSDALSPSPHLGSTQLKASQVSLMGQDFSLVSPINILQVKRYSHA